MSLNDWTQIFGDLIFCFAMILAFCVVSMMVFCSLLLGKLDDIISALRNK